jgi:hypothetical protein
MSRRPARATQADIARAVRAAGPDRVVEVAPDGTIRIVPRDPQRLAQATEQLDDGGPVEL